MKRLALHLFFIIVFSLARAGAVEEVTSGTTYNTTDPTSADIPNWTTGWGADGITGWNYVGTVAGVSGTASGVYLGNDWVITAAHVGPGTFVLGSGTYTVVADSAQSISLDGTMADITLFQISSAPVLPSLTISGSGPTPISAFQPGSQVAMIGYGGGQGETWGFNTVTQINQQVQLEDYPYTTNDFETDYGPINRGIESATNNAVLVLGDSGGGDFTYNSSTSQWELTGLNEAVSGSDSYMIQLSTYATQIDAITAVPEPATYALLGLGGLTLFLLRKRLVSRRA